MRFCGIVTSLLLVHNLPPNWTTTFSQNLERSTLTNRPISTPHTHKLTVNCYFRGYPAGPLSKGSKTTLIWWAWKDETEAKQPHLFLSFSVPSSHSLLSRLFFTEGKAETCLVCFSPSIGSAPAFKAQVLVSRESSFTKTWGGSQVHRGGVNVRRGRLSRLYFSTSLSLINVFFFQTGQTVVSFPSNSRQHILLSWVNLNPVTLFCCFLMITVLTL